MSELHINKLQRFRNLRIQRSKNTEYLNIFKNVVSVPTIADRVHTSSAFSPLHHFMSYVARRSEKRSHGGFWYATVYFRRQNVRAVSSGRGPSIPRNRINILSLLSTELHNEWRAKSSNAEEEEALEWGCRQWRNSFYHHVLVVLSSSSRDMRDFNYE